MTVSILISGVRIRALLKFTDPEDALGHTSCLCFDVRKTFARVVATNLHVLGASRETRIKGAASLPPFQAIIDADEFENVKEDEDVEITLEPGSGKDNIDSMEYTVSYGNWSSSGISRIGPYHEYSPHFKRKPRGGAAHFSAQYMRLLHEVIEILSCGDAVDYGAVILSRNGKKAAVVNFSGFDDFTGLIMPLHESDVSRALKDAPGWAFDE